MGDGGFSVVFVEELSAKRESNRERERERMSGRARERAGDRILLVDLVEGCTRS